MFMSKLSLFLILFQLNIIFISSSTLNEPLQFLRKKFQAKIDTNLYYYYQYIRQENGNYPCTSLDGPYCQYFQNNTLIQLAQHNVSPEIQQIKKNILQNVQKLVKQYDENENSGQKKQIYFANQSRQVLDQKMFYEPANEVTPIPYLIAFDTIKILNDDMKESKYFNIKMIKDKQVVRYEFITKEQEDLIFNDNYMEPQNKDSFFIATKNLYSPSEEIVDSQQNQKQKFQKQNEAMSFEQQQKKHPSRVYLYTKQEKGYIKWSQPIQVTHMYIRYQNFDPKNKKDFDIKGYMGDKLIFDQNVKHKESFNKWIPVSINSKAKINKLEIPPNSNIDNISFQQYVGQEYQSDEDLIEQILNANGPLKQNGIKTIVKKVKLEDLQNIFQQNGMEIDVEDINLFANDITQDILQDILELKDDGDFQIEMQTLDIELDTGSSIKDIIQQFQEELDDVYDFNLINQLQDFKDQTLKEIYPDIDWDFLENKKLNDIKINELNLYYDSLPEEQQEILQKHYTTLSFIIDNQILQLYDQIIKVDSQLQNSKSSNKKVQPDQQQNQQTKNEQKQKDAKQDILKENPQDLKINKQQQKQQDINDNDNKNSKKQTKNKEQTSQKNTFSMDDLNDFVKNNLQNVSFDDSELYLQNQIVKKYIQILDVEYKLLTQKEDKTQKNVENIEQKLKYFKKDEFDSYLNQIKNILQDYSKNNFKMQDIENIDNLEFMIFKLKEDTGITDSEIIEAFKSMYEDLNEDYQINKKYQQNDKINQRQNKNKQNKEDL